MNSSQKDPAISERLRRLVQNKYPTRGRFGVMETVSGIKANRWKNFFYKKQEANQEMLEFWIAQYPDSKDWLLTGIESPEQGDFPFGAAVPPRWEGQTVSDRLNWVISEWAAPAGEQLFSYLEEKTGKKVTAAEWAEVILKRTEPTLPMIHIVCEYRPLFTEWIVRGRVSGSKQVDPTDKESVERHKKHEAERFEAMIKATKIKTKNS